MHFARAMQGEFTATQGASLIAKTRNDITYDTVETKWAISAVALRQA